ncbi:hypothetical protein MRS44_002442 [Fusarium solani]|uniref:uncharacterized protein n=1 Tax=Fusarium solani TaxID=169388 RepID=UPI0032C4674F|nr:hypothetical protein MRS44_002442 [Fusarium solani]
MITRMPNLCDNEMYRTTGQHRIPSCERQSARYPAKPDQLHPSEESFSTGPGLAYPQHLIHHVDATSCSVSNHKPIRTAEHTTVESLELYMLTYLAFRSLYRRSLKLALDWAVHRHLWRGQALYIRSLFEANRNVTDPRHQRVRRQLAAGGRLQADNGIQALLSETEKLLESWKHPDPYTPPTAPGGSKFERNLPSPILDPPPHPVNRH